MELFRQTLWFLLCWIVGFLLASILISTLAPLLGIHDFEYLLEQIKKGEYLEHLNTLKIIQMIGHFCIYTIPPILFANFLMRQKIATYLYLDTKFKPVNIPLILLLFLAAYPVAMWVYYLNMQIVPDAWVAKETLEVEMRMMEMKTPTDLALNLLMLGIVAGLGEELLFRGVIQRLSMLFFKNIHVAIWFTGLIFSLIHFQPEGFFPRFLLGTLLGYVFLWTGSLWASIIGHITFNASQVMIFYLFVDTFKHSDPKSMPDFPIIYSIISLLILIFACFGLMRLNTSLDVEKYAKLPETAKLPF